MYEIDMLEGALRSKDRRIAGLEQQRDKLREALAEAERLQRENYGDGSGLHVAMIYWADKARAALKATEEG